MKNTSFLNILVLLIGILLSSTISFAQEEFMIFGKLRIQGENISGATIAVESDKRQYGRSVQIDSTGEFQIWLKYGKDYIVKFSKPGFQTVPITVSTKLPEGIPNCCFTPFELSFHLFKPDGIHDSLFRKPIVTVRYEPKLKSYFYSLDVDYYIQKMYIKATNDRQQKIKDQAFIAKHKDSLMVEKKYMNLVNSGNIYYSLRQYSMAQLMFRKALELKPNRKYPSYKLEDIETQLEIFSRQRDSLPSNADSIVAATIKDPDEKKIQTVYKRKTPEELDALFKKDLHKQIASETKNKKELEKRLSFVNKEVLMPKKDSIMPTPPIISKKDTVLKNIDTTSKIVSKIDTIAQTAVIKKDTIQPIIDTTKKIVKDTIKPQPIKPIQEVPIKTVSPKPYVFNKQSYQDSLQRKYPNERTIEIITEDYKKITKVIINRNHYVTIYLKIEHKWGGVFFFRDNTPYAMENISKSYFEVETKLLSEKQPVKTIDRTKQQNKGTTQNQTKKKK